MLPNRVVNEKWLKKAILYCIAWYYTLVSVTTVMKKIIIYFVILLNGKQGSYGAS